MNFSIKVLLCILIAISCSCSNDGSFTSIDDNCKESLLLQFNMKEYDGGNIPCGQSYLIAYKKGTSIFGILNNDCADLSAQHELIDCFGTKICTTIITHESCFKLIQSSIKIGVIGVSK